MNGLGSIDCRDATRLETPGLTRQMQVNQDTMIADEGRCDAAAIVTWRRGRRQKSWPAGGFENGCCRSPRQNCRVGVV